MTTYCIEYAKSNRAACRKCNTKIDKGALRIGTSFDGPGDYRMTHWRHMACMKRPPALTSMEELDGISEVQPADAALVEAWWDGKMDVVDAAKRKADVDAAAAAAASTPKKAKSSSAAGPSAPSTPSAATPSAATPSAATPSAATPSAATPMTTVDPGTEEAKRAEADAVFSQLSVPQLKSCLRENKQLLGGNKPELVARCTDRKLYGNLPRCPQCGIGLLKVSYPRALGHGGQGDFSCPGGYDDDAYVRCSFRSREVTRLPWMVTEHETAAPTPRKSGGKAKSSGGD